MSLAQATGDSSSIPLPWLSVPFQDAIFSTLKDSSVMDWSMDALAKKVFV